MIELALVILLGLFVLGFVKVPGFDLANYHLFTLNNHAISLYEVIFVLVIFGLLTILPSVLRAIVGALAIIWILATLDIIAAPGLPNILIIVMIVILIFNRSFHRFSTSKKH